MARERMVTRTVEEARVSAMVANIKNKTIDTAVYSISATIPEEKRLTFLQKHFQTDDTRIVTIVSTEIVQTLYGMPEVDFIKLAKILPPRTGKEENEDEG